MPNIYLTSVKWENKSYTKMQFHNAYYLRFSLRIENSHKFKLNETFSLIQFLCQNDSLLTDENVWNFMYTIYYLNCLLVTCIIDILFYEKVQKLKKWYSNEPSYNIMLFTSRLVKANDNDQTRKCIFF